MDENQQFHDFPCRGTTFVNDEIGKCGQEAELKLKVDSSQPKMHHGHAPATQEVNQNVTRRTKVDIVDDSVASQRDPEKPPLSHTRDNSCSERCFTAWYPSLEEESARPTWDERGSQIERISTSASELYADDKIIDDPPFQIQSHDCCKDGARSENVKEGREDIKDEEEDSLSHHHTELDDMVTISPETRSTRNGSYESNGHHASGAEKSGSDIPSSGFECVSVKKRFCLVNNSDNRLNTDRRKVEACSLHIPLKRKPRPHLADLRADGSGIWMSTDSIEGKDRRHFTNPRHKLLALHDNFSSTDSNFSDLSVDSLEE